MVELIVLGLATWRISSIIQRERIATAFRRIMGESYNELLMVNTYADTFTGHLISCFLCVSVWGGALTLVLYLLNPYLVYPFAASALAIAIDKVI